jgi:DNA-binding NarL/FixJ family response regulator
MAIKKCANCGNAFFIPQTGWGYAYDGHYTCTYHCMREMRRNDMTDEQKHEVLKLLEEGLSAPEIAEKVGVTGKAVGAIKASLVRKGMAEAPVEAPVVEEQTQQRELSETDRMVLILIRDMLDLIKVIYR